MAGARTTWTMLALTLAVAGCGRASPGPSGSSAASGIPRQPVAPSSTAAGGPSSSAHPRGQAAVPGPTVTASRTATLRPLAHALPSAFSAVEFLNARDGWLGAAGRVGATTDGGLQWSWHRLKGVQVDSLSFANPRTGWLGGLTAGCQSLPTRAAGCADILARTTDGGRHWSIRKTTPCARSPSCSGPTIHFTGPRHGWAIVDCSAGGAGGRPCRRVMTTTDGGAVWTTPALPSGFAATDLAVVSAQDVWLAGIRCGASAQGPGLCPTALEHTTNGGRTWSSPGLPGKLAGGGLLSFATAADGWLQPSPATYCTMGGCWVPLYGTTNGGRTWRRVPSSYQRTGFQGQPEFVSPTTGFIPIQAGAGNGVGGVARTTDGGRHWASVGRRRRWTIAALSAVDGSNVWAIGGMGVAPLGTCGGAGFLLHSTNGGRTWHQQLPAPRPQQAIDFLTTKAGFGLGLASDPGAVLHTVNGGRTWQPVAHLAATHAWLAHVSFVNDQVGWAAGWKALRGQAGCCHPLLLRTLDGGRTWQPAGHRSQTVMGLRFFTSRAGLLVSSANPGTGGPTALQTSTDGGRTWTRGAAVPSGQQLLGIDFASPSVGWAMDLRAARGSTPTLVLQRTSDGGRHWLPSATFPFGQGTASVFAGRHRSVWVAQPTRHGTSLLHNPGGGSRWRQWQLSLPGICAGDFGVRGAAWLLTPTSLWRSTDGDARWTQVA